MKIVDLSVPIMNYSMDTHEQPITYLDHCEVARQRAKSYGVPADRFPLPGVHSASEIVTLSTHAGTHMDAPSRSEHTFGVHSTKRYSRLVTI